MSCQTGTVVAILPGRSAPFPRVCDLGDRQPPPVVAVPVVSSKL